MGLSETVPVKGILGGLSEIEGSFGSGRDAIQLTATSGPVILLGAPGVGKGTQSDALARIWRIPNISTGEILRANVADGTALGIQADKVMRSGGLVPDSIITEMVANRIADSDAASGFILDGFPRTAVQAGWLDGHLAVQQKSASLTIVNLHMEPQRIIDRIVYRRICPCCKAVYNTRLRPPKRNGRCDRDGASLEQRSDDNMGVFQERINAFKRQTEPLIEYYRRRHMFIMIDADRPAREVTQDIVESIARRKQ